MVSRAEHTDLEKKLQAAHQRRYEDQTKYNEDIHKLQKAQNANLDLIIDTFGLREQYPDVVNPEGYWYTNTGPYGVLLGGRWIPTTAYGRDQFIADVKAIGKAKDVEAARTRLGL